MYPKFGPGWIQNEITSVDSSFYCINSSGCIAFNMGRYKTVARFL